MITAKSRGSTKTAIEKISNLASNSSCAIPNGNLSYKTRHPTSGSKLQFNDQANKMSLTSGEIPQNTGEVNGVLTRGRRGGARDTINMFNKVAEANQARLDRNPFSETYSVQNFKKSANDYGRPAQGSKTEARGIKASIHVSREVLFLCEIINEYAQGDFPNRCIKFGPLFCIYSHYSDKLVGMLIRARKYKLVDFEGEMLYQKQDDDKIIRMLMPIEEIRKNVGASGDPMNCIAVKK